MTTPLDTIRYHSGIAGEEVAELVDSLEQEVSYLREQVEKLTKERNAFQDQCIRLKNKRAVKKKQLAALAEQNEKMRKALTKWRYLDSSYNWRCGPCGNEVEKGHKKGCALSLTNLATPVLNRIKAEAYREAAGIVGPEDSYQDDWFKAKADSCAKLRAKADELEQSK